MTFSEHKPSPTALAYGFAAVLFGHTIIASTTRPDGADHIQAVPAAVRRSYTGPTPLAQGNAPVTTSTLPAAVADGGIVIGPARVEDRVVKEVRLLQELGEGWDGERAQPPRVDAVNDAIKFLRLAGSRASRLEATAHPDGSVVLEIEDGSEGSFRFKGNGLVICTADRIEPQTLPLAGRGFLVELESAITA